MDKERLGSVNVAGLRLEAPVMIGAGPVKLPEHILELAQSNAAAIVLGSITVEERLGNSGRTYFLGPNESFSLNSKGLPNPGLKYYTDHLSEMVQIAHDHGKPLIISAAGFSPEEYARLSEVIMNSGADGQELNLGCPNVWGKDGKQKRITSFDEDLISETLRLVEQEVGSDGWTSIKLSPYSDPITLERIAAILGHSALVKAITASNTFPNALSFNEQGEPTINPGGGLAGMAGAAMKPINLGQVNQLRRILPEMALIGVGGISTNQDVVDYLRAGANATQVTTAYINLGPRIFSDIRGL